MLVSNRLIRAALRAFADQMASEADSAIKRYESGAVFADYAGQASTIRSILESYGEDISITSTKVLLPGEKV